MLFPLSLLIEIVLLVFAREQTTDDLGHHMCHVQRLERREM